MAERASVTESEPAGWEQAAEKVPEAELGREAWVRAAERETA